LNYGRLLLYEPVENIRCYFLPASFWLIFPENGAELVRIDSYSFAFIIRFHEKFTQK